jgi:peroxiredoxin
MTTRWALAALLAVSAISTSCASTPPPRSLPNPLVGDLMPPFQSTTLSGNPVISGGYQGHKVIVSFVGVQCAPCTRVLSAAQAVYADDSKVVVVGVFRRDDPDASARSVAAGLELKFPIVVDRDGTMARRFMIDDKVPSTFVVGESGRVSWVGGSDVTEDTLLAAVNAAE